MHRESRLQLESPLKTGGDPSPAFPCTCAMYYAGQVNGLYVYYGDVCSNPGSPVAMYSTIPYGGSLGCGSCARGDAWCKGDPPPPLPERRRFSIYMPDENGVDLSKSGLRSYHDTDREYFVPNDHVSVLNHMDFRSNVNGLSVRVRTYLIRVDPPADATPNTSPPNGEWPPLYVAIGLEVEDTGGLQLPTIAAGAVVDDRAFTVINGGIAFDVVTRRLIR